MRDDKREFRQIKRDVKRIGNRKRRRFFQRKLEESPLDDQPHEYDFRRFASKPLNAQDGSRKSPPAEDESNE